MSSWGETGVVLGGTGKTGARGAITTRCHGHGGGLRGHPWPAAAHGEWCLLLLLWAQRVYSARRGGRVCPSPLPSLLTRGWHQVLPALAQVGCSPGAAEGETALRSAPGSNGQEMGLFFWYLLQWLSWYFGALGMWAVQKRKRLLLCVPKCSSALRTASLSRTDRDII